MRTECLTGPYRPHSVPYHSLPFLTAQRRAVPHCCIVTYLPLSSMPTLVMLLLLLLLLFFLASQPRLVEAVVLAPRRPSTVAVHRLPQGPSHRLSRQKFPHTRTHARTPSGQEKKGKEEPVAGIVVMSHVKKVRSIRHVHMIHTRVEAKRSPDAKTGSADAAAAPPLGKHESCSTSHDRGHARTHTHSRKMKTYRTRKRLQKKKHCDVTKKKKKRPLESKNTQSGK